MPLSLRLPADIESEIAAFGARHKVSKSSVIVRSIREFLVLHAQPSPQEMYRQEMQAAAKRALTDGARRQATKGGTARIEVRPHKIKFQQLMREKHARRTGQAPGPARSAATKSRA